MSSDGGGLLLPCIAHVQSLCGASQQGWQWPSMLNQSQRQALHHVLPHRQHPDL